MWNRGVTCATGMQGDAARVERLGVVAFVAALILMVATAFAGNHSNTSNGMTLAGEPLAIHGYDPVAYFTERRARPGTATYTATYDHAAYRFTSQENMDVFKKDPERYLPQYGGFCAFGVPVGAKFDGDPTLWRVVDGKLYFNLNRDIQKDWLKNIPTNIEKADRNWQMIRDKEPRELK